MTFPPDGFAEYVSPGCDRAEFIQEYLERRGVQSVCINLGGKKHICVKFPAEHYNRRYKIKTVISHYDRAPDSPGANDNSAANFCLMDWAARLAKNFSPNGNVPAGGRDFHNVRILFTDGEELGSNSVVEQGAFALATIFKRVGMAHDDVYVFDCVGRGTVPVLGKNDGLTAPSFAFQKQLADLERRAKNLFEKSCGGGRWLSLPLSYSDNAGFVACGIPAVAITMLPEKEADSYMKHLMKEKRLEAFVLRRCAAGCFDESRESEIERRRFESMLPETWQLFHTKYDSVQSLEAESFCMVAKILDALAIEKTPSKAA